jgi:hypothetical protein
MDHFQALLPVVFTHADPYSLRALWPLQEHSKRGDDFDMRMYCGTLVACLLFPQVH